MGQYDEPKKYIRSYGDGPNINPAWVAWRVHENEFEDAERYARINAQVAIDQAREMANIQQGMDCRGNYNSIINVNNNGCDEYDDDDYSDYDEGYNDGYDDGYKDGYHNAKKKFKEKYEEQEVMAHTVDDSNKYQKAYNQAFDGEIELDDPYMYNPNNHSEEENKKHFQEYGEAARYDANDYPDTKGYKRDILENQKQYDFIKAHMGSINDFRIAMGVIDFIRKN